MNSYFYSPKEVIRSFCADAAIYNMLGSYLFSFGEALSALSAFFIGIGQTRAGENIRKKEFAQKDRVVNTSLFPLVESRDLNEIIKSEEAVKGVQSSLTRLLIDIARPLITHVLDSSKERVKSEEESFR